MTLELVYTTYKPYFLEILQSRGFSENKSVEIYQEAVTSLFHKEDSSTFTALDSELKRRINVHLEAWVLKLESQLNSLSDYQKILFKQFKNLPKSQQELLNLYYYRNLSVSEIAVMKQDKDSRISEAKDRATKRLQHLMKTNGV